MELLPEIWFQILLKLDIRTLSILNYRGLFSEILNSPNFMKQLSKREGFNAKHIAILWLRHWSQIMLPRVHLYPKLEGEYMYCNNNVYGYCIPLKNGYYLHSGLTNDAAVSKHMCIYKAWCPMPI